MIEFNTLTFAVEGYPDRWSYRPGETVMVHCSSLGKTFDAEVARVGAAREVVWHRAGIAGSEHAVPADASAAGCNWPVSFTIDVGADWRSGFYEVVLTADGVPGTEPRSHAFFVVRSAAPGRDNSILLVLGTNTYNAYNKWGGACLYTGAPRVSFQRPLERGFIWKPTDPDGYDGRLANLTREPDPDHGRLQAYLADNKVAMWSASGGWFNWERRFVRFAEANGFRLDYAINSDLEFRPEILERYKLMLSVGHDEYWSWGMRDAAERFIERGGNLAFFSGNTVYWQVRYEDEGQTMVCHKYAARQKDPVANTDRQHLLTSIWSDPLIERPENRLTGLSFCRGGYARFGNAVPRGACAYTIYRPDHWAFAGTGLRYGDALGLETRLVGYEVDGCELALEDGLPVPTGNDGTPKNLSVLATAPAHLISNTPGNNEGVVPLSFDPEATGDLEYTTEILLGDASPASTRRLAHGHAVMGVYERGGTVFNAGVTDWAYGLDRDPLVQQITRNVLTRLA